MTKQLLAFTGWWQTMSNPYSLSEDGIADEYGNRHQLVEEIARGGQGVV